VLVLHKAESSLFDLHVYNDTEIKNISRKKVVWYFFDECRDSFELVGFDGLSAKRRCCGLKDKREIVEGKPNPEFGTLPTKIEERERRIA
jgi:hypothetical protein